MKLLLRKGALSDTESLIQFLDKVKADIPQKEWFYLDPPESVRAMMNDGTMELWLAEAGKDLAAVFTVLYPGLAKFNYGYDLDLSVEELLRVVHMDTSAVHPNYRGLGLQKQMVNMAERELAGCGSRILLCTVHPENRYSLKNMCQSGYEIQKRVSKYGSERYILRKDIF